MSLKSIAVISAVSYMNRNKDEEADTTRPPVVPVYGVNVVLGGAMMSGIIITVFLICYCCHRNHSKRQTNLPRYWQDPGLPMEIYTVGGQQRFEMPPRAINMGAPPPYESVVNTYKDKDEINVNKKDDSGLPTYETAIEMAHNEGRVV